MPRERQHLGHLPMLLALRVAMGSSPSCVLAFADDLRVALSRASNQLLRLRSFCRILERAVALGINGGKAKVVAMTAGATLPAQREARSRKSPLSGMQVVSTARYLGFMVHGDGCRC